MPGEVRPLPGEGGEVGVAGAGAFEMKGTLADQGAGHSSPPMGMSWGQDTNLTNIVKYLLVG